MSEPQPPRQGLADEAAHHRAWLAGYRDHVADRVLALTPSQRRARPLPSGWSPVELLSHLLHMERRWFVWGFLAEPVDDPWGDSVDPHDGTTPWSVAEDVDAEELVAELVEVAARTEQVLSSIPLDAVAAVGGRFGPDDLRPDLRWICFHVLREYVQHAGHLDAAAELLLAGGVPGREAEGVP